MGWQDQGRQEHGWFGHGQGHGTTGNGYTAIDREMSARIKAGFEFALDHLRGEPGGSSLPYRDTRETLAALAPSWVAQSDDPPNTFRKRFFGDDTDPLDSWSLQRVAKAVRLADTYARLRAAGTELAHAISTIGIPQFRTLLRAAEDRSRPVADPLDKASIRRVADEAEEHREEEAAEKRLFPHVPLAPPRVPSVDETPEPGGLGPRIGGAAVLREDRARAGSFVPPAVERIPPEQLRFSQRTAGGNGRADKQRQFVKENGTITSPVDAVRTPDGIVSIDNTRVAVAREKGLADIPVRVWEPSDPIPADMGKRFRNARTWGDALQERLARQRPALSQTGASEVPRMPKEGNQ